MSPLRLILREKAGSLGDDLRRATRLREELVAALAHVLGAPREVRLGAAVVAGAQLALVPRDADLLNGLGAVVRRLDGRGISVALDRRLRPIGRGHQLGPRPFPRPIWRLMARHGKRQVAIVVLGPDDVVPEWAFKARLDRYDATSPSRKTPRQLGEHEPGKTENDDTTLLARVASDVADPPDIRIWSMRAAYVWDSMVAIDFLMNAFPEVTKVLATNSVIPRDWDPPPGMVQDGFSDLVTHAREHGIAFFAAAGDNGATESKEVVGPAAFPSALAVGGWAQPDADADRGPDGDDYVHAESSWGPPKPEFLGSWTRGGGNGTSAAVGEPAGALALVLHTDPEIALEEALEQVRGACVRVRVQDGAPELVHPAGAIHVPNLRSRVRDARWRRDVDALLMRADRRIVQPLAALLRPR